MYMIFSCQAAVVNKSLFLSDLSGEITVKKKRWSNQHISMIFEGPCDWSNDAKNSALHHKNKLHFVNVFKQNIYFK